MSLYSVVVPVYNSEHTLGELYTRLEKVFRETLKEDFELILVDDGSKDRSYEIMTELREKDHRVRIIQMARNFGQHPALLCGFAHVKGEFVVTMDDDLQHQPEELPKMVRTMQERPDVDVIIASYEGRKNITVSHEPVCVMPYFYLSREKNERFFYVLFCSGYTNNSYQNNIDRA